VGHLGGDDFMVISTPPYAPILAQKICSAFDAHAINFYDEKDFARKSITIPNRQGTLQTFQLITLSIAIVSNEQRHISSIPQIAHLAAELKCYAKTTSERHRGSWYVKDRRLT
jgi:GGDEF domain-containing protein